MTKKMRRIDWKKYKENLKGAIKNEELWALGSGDRATSIMHTMNADDMRTELDMIEEGRFVELVKMKGAEWFRDFMSDDAEEKEVYL